MDIRPPKLENCKRIGCMGGTFNPIHSGHVLMAQWAKEFADLDAVLFIPTGNPYMKAGTDILDGNLRLDMVNLSIEGEESFFSSDMELRREGDTYTCDTIRELHEKYPNAQLFFIVGADSLYSFERWYHPDQILEHAVLLAAARNGAKKEELEAKSIELMMRFGGEIRLMEFPAFDVSSTMVRQRVRDGKSIHCLVPDKVREYIDQNSLYMLPYDDMISCDERKDER